MNLFILGATGKTGVELVDLALARGHHVTAFVRSPAKISRRDERLKVVEGDPRSDDAIARALAGHDAVLSALGPRPKEALTRTTLLQETGAATVAAMATAGVKRLLIISSAMLYPSKSLPFVLSRWIIAPHYRDLRAMETVVTASPLEWTVVRPPRLVRHRDEAFEADTGGAPPAHHTVSHRAVAAYMVAAAGAALDRRQIVALCR
jgi:putative NADH-flavin reductase